MGSIKMNKGLIRSLIIILIVLVIVVLLGKFILSRATTKSPVDLTKSFMKEYKVCSDKIYDSIEYPFSDTLNDTQLTTYKDLIKKQFLSLNYDIVEENIGEIDANIKIEFSVYDYKSSYERADNYISLYGNDMNNDKKIDYKLKEMKDTDEKVIYGITFNFYKLDGKWYMADLSKGDYKKLEGTF